jgi:hypothetical protein
MTCFASPRTCATSSALRAELRTALEVFATVPERRLRPGPLAEPDWRRFPGWRTVTRREWEDVTWQRQSLVRSIEGLHRVLGRGVADAFYEDLTKDQEDGRLPSTPLQLLEALGGVTAGALTPDSGQFHSVWRRTCGVSPGVDRGCLPAQISKAVLETSAALANADPTL